jgi:hypothetical protein
VIHICNLEFGIPYFGVKCLLISGFNSLLIDIQPYDTALEFLSKSFSFHAWDIDSPFAISFSTLPPDAHPLQAGM